MKQEAALIEVSLEATIARGKFPAFQSPHEGLAVILEEFEELKSEVFKQFDDRSIANLRGEAKQLSAMALRFMIDLT